MRKNTWEKVRVKIGSAATATLLILTFSIETYSQIKYEIVVAKDGTGDYTTIQEAVNSAKNFPDKRIFIYVKNGIYKEKVKIHAWNTQITLKGESAEKTIVTYDDNINKEINGYSSTFITYTMLVEGDDFHAENLTFENSSGMVGQAVALHVEGDRCVFKNCRILGYQDSLYASGQNSRQYFVHCYIEGTTDFIFGSATALFEECIIHSLRNSHITAASTPYGKPYGFVFMNCRLTADEGVDQVTLGRPWRDYANVVYIQCEMGPHIKPMGWSNWQQPHREKTSFYAEYKSSGEGGNPAQRVSWCHLLTDEEALEYTKEKILAPVLPHEPEVDSWTNPD